MSLQGELVLAASPQLWLALDSCFLAMRPSRWQKATLSAGRQGLMHPRAPDPGARG